MNTQLLRFSLLICLLLPSILAGQSIVKLKDIRPGSGSNPVALGSTGYFIATGKTTTGSIQEQLFYTDGTPTGTILISDDYVFTPIRGEIPVIKDGFLYFGTASGLYKSDGTKSGTILIKAYENLNYVFIHDNVIHFGRGSIWKTDGTPTGTVNVINSNFSVLGSAGKRIIGTYYDGSSYGIWALEGSVKTQLKVYNANSYGISMLGTVANKMVFQDGQEVWITDGTVAGTVLLKSFTTHPLGTNTYPRFGQTTANGVVYFALYQGGKIVESWQTNGTTQGTIKTEQPVDLSLYSQEFVGYFDITNVTLMTKDGLFATTSNDPKLRKIINLTTGSVWALANGAIDYLGYNNNILYYEIILPGTTTFPFVSVEVWRSDMTVAGTYKVGTFTNDLCSFFVINNLPYLVNGAFYRFDTSGGKESLKSIISIPTGYYLTNNATSRSNRFSTIGTKAIGPVSQTNRMNPGEPWGI